MYAKRRPSKAVKIITLTGSSGAGKTTIAKELLKLRPDLQIVISLTTRSKRDSDIPGEYRYDMAKKEFERLRVKDVFLWTVEVHDNEYGTMRESVDEALRAKHLYLMILEPNVLEILTHYTEGKVSPFYVFAPTEEVLLKRRQGRGDREETVERRIRDCKEWDENAKKSAVPYIFITNNDTVEKAVKQVLTRLPSVK